MNVIVSTLFSVLVFCLAASPGVKAGVQCYGGAVEAAARAGQSIEHPRSYTCPGGCRCQCVAAVFELCNLPETRLWRKGDHVMSNCDSLPKYTAIATFDSEGRYYGHTGIFNRCVGGQIEMFDQWCGAGFQLRRKGSTDYYVIEL